MSRSEADPNAPTPSELAAIVAAVEVAWPRPAVTADAEPPPVWRFSGRWWAKPGASRRTRLSRRRV